MMTRPKPPTPMEEDDPRALREALAAEHSVRAVLPALAGVSLFSSALSLLLDTGAEPLPGVLGFSFTALLAALWRASAHERVKNWAPMGAALLCWFHAAAVLMINPALAAVPAAAAILSTWWLFSALSLYAAAAAAVVFLAIYVVIGASLLQWFSTASATLVVLLLSGKLRGEWNASYAEAIAAEEQAAEAMLVEEEETSAAAEESEAAREHVRILEAHGEIDRLWKWDLIEETVSCSPRWQEFFDYDDRDAVWASKDWFNLVHPHDISDLTRQVRRHLDGAGDCFEHEHRVRQADGEFRWVLSRGRVVHDETGVAVCVVGSHSDLRRVKSYEEQLLHQATHDAVTGLANREKLAEWLAEEHTRTKQSSNYGYAVALFDLDGLKNINDSLGHAAGDHVLAATGQRFVDFLSSEHSAARVGGDEFAVLLRGVRVDDDALSLVREAVDRISRPIRWRDVDIDVEVSAGVAAGEDHDDPEAVLRNADIALAAAKRADQVRVSVFDSEMGRAASRRFLLQREVREAFDQERFELFYQPILSAQEGRIVCAEALLRLRNKDGSVTPPAEVIPVIEESGLIHDLGRWILDEGCRQVMAWSEAGLPLIEVSINVSTRQFGRADFLEGVQAALQRSGLPAKKLQLEITESDLVDLKHLAPEALDRLALLGVKTAIDDFGVGYSALSYLRDLSCNTLKIDRSFVTGLAVDARSGAVARSIIGLAHNLDLSVVAEGVETPAQIDFLRGAGCDRLQGYFASRPVPAPEFRKLLEDGGRLGIGPKPAARARSSSGPTIYVSA